MASSLHVVSRPAALPHAKAAIERGTLTVGYLGGSITDSRPRRNWSTQTTDWLADRFGEARIVEENAAIGATGSALGVFLAEPHILQRGCDLVFVEFAVNDQGVDPTIRGRSREGLIRKLLAGGRCDVVLTYTFSHPMYEDMAAGRVPDSVAQFERIGAHYGLPGVWMGLHALQQVHRGRLRWEQWLPDGLHPGDFGSSLYKEAVAAYLDDALGTAGAPAPAALPDPLDPEHWGDARRIDLDAVRTGGHWVARRVPDNHWMGLVLESSDPGATATASFEGRNLLVGLDWGALAAACDVSVDGGPWRRLPLDYPDWMGPLGWFRPVTVASDLDPGAHEVALRFGRSDEQTAACTARIALVGTW